MAYYLNGQFEKNNFITNKGNHSDMSVFPSSMYVLYYFILNQNC